MLTARQRETFDFLVAREDAGQLAPTYAEFKAELGLASAAGVHRLLTALERKGYVRRLPYQARAIEVVRNRAAAPTRAPIPLEAAARDLVACMDAPDFGGGSPYEQARLLGFHLARLRSALEAHDA